jgi:hypothetical protein
MDITWVYYIEDEKSVLQIKVNTLDLPLICEVYHLIKANKTVLELKVSIKGMMNKDTTYFSTICNPKFTGP